MTITFFDVSLFFGIGCLKVGFSILKTMLFRPKAYHPNAWHDGEELEGVA